jgi:hypothetical protein
MVSSGRWDRLAETFDWILRVIGVVCLAFVLWLYTDVRDQGNCQAQVNEAQTQRTINLEGNTQAKELAERKADDALTALTTHLLKPRPDPVETRRLFVALQRNLATQQAAREKADESRAANPPVRIPSHC